MRTECERMGRDSRDCHVAAVWRPIIAGPSERGAIAASLGRRLGVDAEALLSDTFHYSFGTASELATLVDEYARAGVDHLVAYLPQASEEGVLATYASEVARCGEGVTRS